MVSWLFVNSRPVMSSIQYIPNPAFSNKLLLTACKIRASNCKILLLRSSSFQNSKLTFYLVIKVEFEDCSLQQLHISSSVHHSILWFYSGSSASGTLSRNHQGSRDHGSREDLHSAESRDSRLSTHANSQSSSVYDNVQKVLDWFRQVSHDLNTGLWLVETDHLTSILASDWSRQVTWPEYWPLIGGKGI